MTIRNLPYQRTPFIGRTEEIAELSQLLNDPPCRLLTLTGPGGIGKTRLALEIAARQQDHFPDGVYFVPLQPHAPGTSILGMIVEALPIRATGSNDLQGELLRYLCERHTLLVLDNFEHLLDQAALIGDMLAAALHIEILATSREALNLHEEWVRQVKGLSYPRQLTEPDEQFDSVRLLAERSRQVNEDFSLIDEYEQVVSICQLVEGMPLALELAAAWRKHMPSARIAHEIAQSLDFLAVDTRNMPLRHRSMRAVFEQSWRMLTRHEQAVFRKLSVFRSGWTLESAEHIAGASLAILARLVDQSLVRLDTSGRYSIHELLRQFGEAQLNEANELEAAQQAHCHYFAHFLQRRESDVLGHGDLTGRRQFQAYYEISMDLENVRTAWLWAIEHREFRALDQGLECLYRYAVNQMLPLIHHELFAQVSKQLAPQGDETPSPIWGRIVTRSVFHHSDDIGIPYLEKAHALARERNDVAEMGHSLWALAFMAIKNGQFTLALERSEQCLILYRQHSDLFYIADALIWVGVCHWCLGHLGEADRYIQQNLALRPSFGDKNGEFYANLFRSKLLIVSGEYIAAEQSISVAFAITQCEDPACAFFWSNACNGGTLLMQHTWRGFIALIRGDHETAQLYRQAIIRSAADLLLLNAKTYLLHFVGFAITVDGDYQRGNRLLEWVCNNIRLEEWFDKPIAHWGLSLAKVSLEADKEAQQLLAELFQAGLRLNSEMLLTLGLPVQAVLLARSGAPVQAVELLGLTFTHPKSATGWMERWPLLTQIRAALEAELETDVYRAAWNRGAALDLESVGRDLLAELQSVYSSTPPNHRQPNALTPREYEVPRLLVRVTAATQEQANQLLVDPLTPRELEILYLMGAGLTNREIADQLVIGVSTVKKHVTHIYGKLGESDRVKAINRARALELLPTSTPYA